jgi:hypothetical protein
MFNPFALPSHHAAAGEPRPNDPASLAAVPSLPAESATRLDPGAGSKDEGPEGTFRSPASGVVCIASPYCNPPFHSFRCETFQRQAAVRRGDPYVQKEETDWEWITR